MTLVDRAVRDGMRSRAEQKADSLAVFARGQGCALSSFELALTQKEAFELLDRLAAGSIVAVADQALLVLDIEQAKRAGDPWQVLGNFQLNGFNMVRADLVLN
jgi:hypothetical protein